MNPRLDPRTKSFRRLQYYVCIICRVLLKTKPTIRNHYHRVHGYEYEIINSYQLIDAESCTMIQRSEQLCEQIYSEATASKD